MMEFCSLFSDTQSYSFSILKRERGRTWHTLDKRET